ncbi:GNAT family N-acetyltransferase [Phaeovulum sp.]|uniref:GNAT family N-acetyltransferase n=1 Tax=Phaeovulum sp. TaxID=2934796 RepID=UPI0039E5B918
MPRIQVGLHDSQRPAAARLYWDAFSDKLGRIMGPERKALRFVERVIDPTHVIAAVDATGLVLGVVGFRDRQGSFVGGIQSDLNAVYGRVGGYWRGRCFSFLARDLTPWTLDVDGLAVHPEHRGEGIGTALIEALCAEATVHGYRELRLEVVTRNARARALYERRGFVVERAVKSRLTALAFAFDTALVMVRRL